MTTPFVIGVTGGIASGKSLVASTLAEFGAETIDGDWVYHDLIEPGSPLNLALRTAFGDVIVKPDGSIDRAVLGRIVFVDPAQLEKLDKLTHPAIDREIRRRTAASRSPVVVVVAVKLIEAGLDRDCDQVWVVLASHEHRIERLMDRNRISREDAIRRIDAQPDFAEHAQRATIVIDNDGPPEATRAQVVRHWRALPPLPIGE